MFIWNTFLNRLKRLRSVKNKQQDFACKDTKQTQYSSITLIWMIPYRDKSLVHAAHKTRVFRSSRGKKPD